MVEQEKDRMKDLTIDCMSEESSDSEGEHMIVHKPVWRSRGKYFNILCIAFIYGCYYLVYIILLHLSQSYSSK